MLPFDFLCDALEVFGDVHLLMGETSSIATSGGLLELWCRVFGFEVPVMMVGLGCKHNWMVMECNCECCFCVVIFSWYPHSVVCNVCVP